MVAVLGEDRHELGHRPICARDAHVGRHDLADRFGLGGVHRAAAPDQLLQPVAHRVVEVDVCMPHEIRERDDADDASLAIHDRQRFDAMGAHQLPGVLQIRAVLHHVHVARHDVLATQVAQAALHGIHFCHVQDVFHVVATDVDDLVVSLQDFVEIGRAEAASGSCVRARDDLAVRIATTGYRVVENPHRSQQHAVHQHGEQREGEGTCMGQRDEQRHCATGRMQAAECEHHRDRATDCDGTRDCRIVEQSHTHDANERGKEVAAHDRPGLRQRTRRNGKRQHGTRTERRDEPGRSPMTCQATYHPGDEYPQQGADCRTEALRGIDGERRGPKALQPGGKALPRRGCAGARGVEWRHKKGGSKKGRAIYPKTSPDDWDLDLSYPFPSRPAIEGFLA
jgi:hypothetical protein